MTVTHTPSGWTTTADDWEDARWVIEADIRRSIREGARRRAFDYTITN